MKLMKPQYRKKWFPFTEQDEQLYKTYKDRRLNLLRNCRYLKLNKREDVKSIIELLVEVGIKHKPFKNISHLILDGSLAELDMDRSVWGRDNRLACYSLWQVLKLFHVCLKDNLRLGKFQQEEVGL
ncbi:uncharacterized protein L201_004644 [Kwoniella dendrophila CBS 6074]|uniref:Uncharacterized protein n=1 Tax=Kwoniella dendrophila CBS 6074 TaxID=1295534 RepID=A0AAX4JXS9_9TREE